MPERLKYFVVFVQAVKSGSKAKSYFPIYYCGKRIIWEYLIDTVKEEFDCSNIQFNGYNEISKEEYELKSVK